MKKIAKEEFFYVVKDNYDDHAEMAIPCYKEMHEELKNILPCNLVTPKVLDLGCGTGYTSCKILEKYPKCKIIGIDLFQEMLVHAKGILSKFTDNVDYVVGDFRTCEWDNDIDICVSALAMHHILSGEKADLFKKIYNSLNMNGYFVCIDWIKSESNEMNELAYRQAVKHLEKSGANEDAIKDWSCHWKELNIPNTIVKTNEMLNIAGFDEVEVIYKYYNMALILAKKK